MNPLKSIKSFAVGNIICRVYRDIEWNEYRARIINNGKVLSKLDYHTDDKTDAIDTARSMLARYTGQQVNTII